MNMISSLGKKTMNRVMMFPPVVRVSLLFCAAALVGVVSVNTIVLAGNSHTTASSASSAQDMNIRFVERTPRYNRYCLTYPSDIPTLCAGTENQKRWPSVGEIATYTAHIGRNTGSSTTKVKVDWLVGGQVVSTQTVAAPKAGSEIVSAYQRAWKDTSEQLQVRVTTVSGSEAIMQNNSLTFGTKDYSLSIFVEKGIYDRFNQVANMTGSTSFYDWIQAHFAKMNQMMAAAKYPTSPNGISARVRIDTVVMATELDSSTSPLNRDPLKELNDGKWQFVDNDVSNASGNNGVYQQYVNQFKTNYDYGLIHELSHQLGMIDMYRFNLTNNPSINNGVQVTDLSGNVVDYRTLSDVFSHPGLMGGGSTEPYNDNNAYDAHEAAAMNTSAGLRRGYFGEFLFDTPTNNSVKILDSLGTPLAGAQVSLYQKRATDEIIDNQPEITGTTTADGTLALPNVAVPSVTTATGHTLRANPFGKINVVGTNGTFLVKIVSGNHESFRWLTVHDLNMAYWAGNTENATHTIQTSIDNRVFGDNIALNKPATSNRTVSGDHSPAKAVDGDTTTAENGWGTDNPTNPGDWIQIDLGQVENVGKVNIYPNSVNSSDWCDAYHIQVSQTGAFAGEQRTVWTETASPHMSVITSAFATTPGRYVRVICDNSQNWVLLQELQVFAVQP